MMKARNAKSAQEINPQASIGFSGPSFGMGAFRGQMQSTVVRTRSHVCLRLRD